MLTFAEWLDRRSAASRRDDGQTMAEYGIVLAVITIGAVGAFTLLSGEIQQAVQRAIDLIPG
jgi:Flp pilus assembly pilin Flp